MDQTAEALLELMHLRRHLLIAEEERRVGQVDHQLGAVFGLREHGLQIPWRFVVHRLSVVCTHQVRPRMTIARISDSAPSRSNDDVTIGMPWLSGSRPSRCALT